MEAKQNNTHGFILSSAGDAQVIVNDIYGNPISNLDVTFTATTPGVTCYGSSTSNNPTKLVPSEARA